jgi:hypothetical protein
MKPSRRSSPDRPPSARRVPMTDRQRTGLAAAESIFGAGLVIAGVVVSRGGNVAEVLGLVLLAFGLGAVAQAVAVGVGLVSIDGGEELDSEHAELDTSDDRLNGSEGEL